MRILTISCGVLFILLISGCSGTPAPDPEEPVREMINAVNEYASILEKLAEQAKPSAPKEAVDAALKKATADLKALETKLGEITDKVKRTNMTKVERQVYNSSERRKGLHETYDRLDRVLGPVTELTRREDVDKRAQREFKDTWEALRARAEQLDADLAKSMPD